MTNGQENQHGQLDRLEDLVTQLVQKVAMVHTGQGELRRELTQRMDGLDARMDGLDARMDKLDGRMNDLTTQMDTTNQRLTALEDGVGQLKNEVNELTLQHRLTRSEAADQRHLLGVRIRHLEEKVLS